MVKLFSARTSIEHPCTRRSARFAAGVLAVLLVAGSSLAFVFRYEGTGAPSPPAWQRFTTGTPERRIEDGWFIQEFHEHGQDYYRYELGGISSLVGNFFVEWRAITDNPEWLIDAYQVPAALSCAGNAASLYHVVMTESAAALTRFDLSRVIVPISVGEPHTYRVEVYSDEYVWYVDGEVVASGVPPGAYPDPNAFIIWGAQVTHDDAPPAATAWDYVRFGQIPDDASGDFNSDGGVTRFDYRFVHDCLTKDGPGIFGGPQQNAGPGCRFTDFDADTDADLLDFAEFANQFTGASP